jgi:hypothetical protein
VEDDTLLGALTTAHRNVVARVEAAKPKRKAAAAKSVRKPSRAKPKIRS